MKKRLLSILMALALCLGLLPATAMAEGTGEQFSLTPGGTYYFDLSGENIPAVGLRCTVNTSLPDTTLHYVPFTYAGTVDAYKLTSAMETTEAYANANKYAHSLFVADYNVAHTVSWDELNTAGLIFGKSYASGGVDYTLRAPSVGSDYTYVNGSDRGIPLSNEWDAILDKNDGYIKNYSDVSSWGQDTSTYDNDYRADRGFTARYWDWTWKVSRSSNVGFRPVLEVMNAGTLGSNGLKAVTLDLGGGKIGSSSDNIQIIVKSGSTFTAPASDGLTRPDGNTGDFFIWLGSDNQLYAPGASVPENVTKLTAKFIPAVFTQQPGDLTLTYGYTTSNNLTVSATAPEGYTLSYQWYSNTTNSNSGGTSINGATQSSYTVPTGKSVGNYYYYCVVTATQTSTSFFAIATSNVATVTVNKAPVSFTVTNNTLTYDGNNRGATVTQTTGQTPSIGNAFAVLYKQSENTVTPKDAGTYEVWVNITSGNFKFDGQEDTVREMKVGALTINRQPVTVSGITANNKVYDGTIDATLDYSGVTLSGKVENDKLSVTATGTFDSKDAGSRTVTISNLNLCGESNGNYELANSGQQATASASITAKDITVTITPGGGCYGNITPATAKLNGLVNRENSTVTLTYTGTANDGTDYNSTTVPTKAGNYTVTASISDTNYNLTGTVTAAFVVTKAEQNAPSAPVVQSKTYYSVTLEEIPDNANGAKAQYSMDGGTTWQDSPVFTGLRSTTEYSFVARYGETDNYFASPASEPVTVRTNNVPASIYPPAVEQPEGGSVAISPSYPTAGAKVTITATPDEGYAVDQVIVTDKNGDPVEVTDNGDGTYSFTQPKDKVTISVTFTKTEQPGGNPFVDVPADAYYYDAVQWAVKHGITEGTNADGTLFNPNAPCTRAQVVTFLWRAAGCPTPKSSEMPFTDVVKGSYYETAVLWAVENGITNGTGDTTFSPDAVCSRAQIVTFLWRAQGTPAAGSANPFLDVAADAYYTDAVLWAVANGITVGTNDAGTAFSPDDDCTRAQIVTFLYRCLGGE